MARCRNGACLRRCGSECRVARHRRRSRAASGACAITEETGAPTTSARVDSATARRWRRPPSTSVRRWAADILCSNVGVQQFGAIDKLTEQDWEWVLNVNVLGTVRTVREFLPMLRAGLRLPAHRLYGVVERARTLGPSGRVPDQQVRRAGLRGNRCARRSRATASASPCSSRAG